MKEDLKKQNKTTFPHVTDLDFEILNQEKKQNPKLESMLRSTYAQLLPCLILFR